MNARHNPDPSASSPTIQVLEKEISQALLVGTNGRSELDISAATGAAQRLGGSDGRSNSIDELSHDAGLPHQDAVSAAAEKLPELAHDAAIKTAAAIRRGDHVPGPETDEDPAPTTWTGKILALGGTVLVVIASIAVLDAFLGSRWWRRIAGVGDNIAVLMGLAFALVLGLGTAAAARYLYQHQPNFVRRRAVPLLITTLLLTLTLLAIMGWVLAGGGGTEATRGSVNMGGTPNNTASSDTSDLSLGLLLGYPLLVLLTLVIVFLSEIIHAHQARTRVVNRRMDRLSNTPNQTQLNRQADDLLDHAIALLPQTPIGARGILTSYIAGARATLTPVQNSVWSTHDLVQHLDQATTTAVERYTKVLQALKTPTRA
jgi:hypothetical protein